MYHPFDDDYFLDGWLSAAKENNTLVLVNEENIVVLS